MQVFHAVEALQATDDLSKLKSVVMWISLMWLFYFKQSWGSDAIFHF